MAVRHFAQKVDVGDDSINTDGAVLETKEITREHYEAIKEDRDAVERGFDGRWDEAFMTLIQAIEAIRDRYRRNAKETEMGVSVERNLLNRMMVSEEILLEAERIKENVEG